MPAITLREAPHRKAIAETTMRYDVLLHGKVVGDLYFNMTGYTGCNLPLPNGSALLLPEAGLSRIKREIALVNREWAAAQPA